ncbi:MULTISPECIES: aminotransferase class IV [unclassified Saccharicrinis]|uniref:aminotransferase class IV n=1 Tax=unclassified Saccharicrinis TaxID=2646859 RepID=UPI003D352E81
MMFVLFNGKIYSEGQVPVTFNNRAFRYGDAIFETIRCNGHYPLHFELHYKRLTKAMLSLKMDISSLPRKNELENHMVKLLQKNKSFAASRVRLQAYRDGEGLYTPQTNKVNFIIESSKLPSVQYQLNTKGLLVDVYPDFKKQYNPVSFFKNGNSLHYVLAACYKQEKELGDCLLINEKEKIIEANSSNLFWIKNGTIYTPSVFSGCVDGVMRNVLIQSVKKSGLAPLIETRGATEQELLNADEIFITNAIQGVQWIVGFKEKRYFCQLTKKVHVLLNQAVFEL